MTAGKLTVDLEAGPDEDDRFRVFLKGTMERWSLEQIKAYALASDEEVVLRVSSTVRRPNPLVPERRDRVRQR